MTPTMKKKSPNGAGTVERRSGLWWLQVLRPLEQGETKRRRGRMAIEGSEKMTETQARRAAVKLAADFRAGKIVFEARSRPANVPSVAAVMTVRQLGEAWTSGKLLEQHGAVNRLRKKAGAYIDSVTLAAHAYGVKTRGPDAPAFGDMSVTAVTAEDLQAVMAAQPKEQRAETRIKQYNRLHRLFELAEFPCRLRLEGTNPVKKYLRPAADADKLFCFLYPSEILAVLGAKHIPLARRVLYALAVYTGQRKGSLFAIRWKHADFEHGTLASFRTKTGRAQYFVADRGLMAVLAGWYAHQGKPGDDEPIVSSAIDVIGCEPKRLAVALRDDLKAAGVTRALLFETDEANVEPLRFHDLRSTFCTWARRAGKSDPWISERTGQEVTGDMINRYDRGAQTLADLDYGPFPDISQALPELAELARLPHRLPQNVAPKTPEPEGAISESGVLPRTSLVGARGFEPPTPTVST
jgi:integrase